MNAAEDGYSTTYTAFMDESGGVTVNMLDCMGSEIDQQDTRLNQNYKAAMQGLAKAQQTQLRDAQRLWIKSAMPITPCLAAYGWQHRPH